VLALCQAKRGVDWFHDFLFDLHLLL